MSDAARATMKAQLDVVHTAIFGWPMDHLTPVQDLLNSPSLKEAARKLLRTERARWCIKDDMPLWPADKWACVDYAGLKIWLNLNDSFVAWGVLSDSWETEEVSFMLANLSPGDAMIDVGANIGVYTLQAARAVGPEGRVYAFEPQTDICAMLKRSIADNGFSENCVVYDIALGNQDQAASIWRHHSNNPGASIITTKAVSEGAQVTQVRRLDSMAIDRPIKFLKMDIEGYEPLLVEGGLETLRRWRPTIITEWFPRSMSQVAGKTSFEFLRLLTDLGYAVHILEAGKLGRRIDGGNVSSFDDIETPFNIGCVHADASPQDFR